MRFNTSNLFYAPIPMKTSTCPTPTIPKRFNTSKLFNSNHTREDFNLSNLNHTNEVQYSSNLFYTPIPMKTSTCRTPTIPMRFNTSNLFTSNHTNEDLTSSTLTIPMRFNTSNLFTNNHISEDFNLFNTNYINEMEHFQLDYNHQSYHYQCSLIFRPGQHPPYNYKWRSRYLNLFIVTICTHKIQFFILFTTTNHTEDGAMIIKQVIHKIYTIHKEKETPTYVPVQSDSNISFSLSELTEHDFIRNVLRCESSAVCHLIFNYSFGTQTLSLILNWAIRETKTRRKSVLEQTDEKTTNPWPEGLMK